MSADKNKIDWLLVEAIMRGVIARTRQLTAEDQKCLERAFAVDPDSYEGRHARIKAEEIKRARRPWDG